MPPTIAFVMATLNEEARVEAAVRSLLQQDYPAELITVAVVDGGSSDRTTEIVERLAAEDPRVRCLENPRRIAAAAFNVGIAATDSAILSLVSAHSETDRSYARVLAEAFDESGAWLVGGRQVSVAGRDTDTARAIVTATSSPLTLGNARFRYSTEPGWVDTAFPGAYRRELFAEIGVFDETLVRNQDDDFHFRARQAGHPMWFDPRLASTYFARPTIEALARQYFGYGYWRYRTLEKHGRLASWRHAVPAALVAGLAAGSVLAWWRPTRRLWAAGTTAYVGAVVVSGGVMARGEESARPAWRRAPLVSAAMAAVQLSYGAGTWTAALGGRSRR